MSTTITSSTTPITADDNKENERKEYLLGLLKKGVQITNREREELMFKFKINDLSIFRTSKQPSSQSQSQEILNDNTLKSFSKLEIKTNGSEIENDDDDTDTDNDENGGNEIKSANLKKYQYREVDEDDKSILQKNNQELSKINNNNNNNNSNYSNNNNNDGDNVMENSNTNINNNDNKHDYVCENCKWCDGYEIDTKSKEQLCINCKCSLIHHITTNNNVYDDDEDDEQDYFNNSSDEADYYGDDN
ncbi:hypothetical protein ACTFIU_010410 [Dictyostelium citrinum]